jgi:hypothetical protein
VVREPGIDVATARVNAEQAEQKAWREVSEFVLSRMKRVA